jgi:hypothetical protein
MNTRARKQGEKESKRKYCEADSSDQHAARRRSVDRYFVGAYESVDDAY